MLFRKKKKKKKNVFALIWKIYFGSRTVRKKISVFLSEENLEKKVPPPPHTHTKIKWSVPKQVLFVTWLVWCHDIFSSIFIAINSTKQQIKQTGIPGIRFFFFAVIFTGTTETLFTSPAGWFWLALTLDSF